MRATLTLILATAITLGLCGLAAADDPKPEKPKPEFPDFKDVMKDFEEVPTAEKPFITLWHNKKKDSLRAQLPASLIGKQFLIANSMSGGSVATGFQFGHFLAYFERMDKKLVLMKVDPRYVNDENSPVSDVIRRSYGGDSIHSTVPILTMKGSDPIIDLDGLFKADFAGIGPMGGGVVKPDLSKWAEFKAFPENVELTADLAIMRGNSGKRTLFHYSLSQIPSSSKGYKARAADDRVGYFMTVRKDWSKKHDADTLFDRYINRWRLEKRDPSAKFSAPKHPIIWYIEKTVPLEYRRYVKEGILEWNKAFEKIGFLDAIEVIQQEDYDPRTKDLDPEDVRYNFFRWIVTGDSFAMGPSRAHPLTGQIFDADIVCDDSMARVYVEEYEKLLGGPESWQAYNPYIQDFFNAHPEWSYHSPIEQLLPNVCRETDPDAQFRMNLRRHMHEHGQPLCECAAGMMQQLAFAQVAMEAKGMLPDREAFMGQIMKEIVCHEVGHCLGLRHNFKGSTWLPFQELAEEDEANQPTSSSIMDYNPIIYAPRGEKQGSFITQGIGPYDYWAIEYGYRPVEKPYTDEAALLKEVAGRCAEAGLDYATDEDTMSFISPDPYTNRFDCGRDVIDFAAHQMDLADSLMKDLKDWAIKDGESYARLRRAFRIVLGTKFSGTPYVARFPGGQILNRDHKGDKDARTPITVVPAERQRAAVDFLCKRLFAEDAFHVDPELISHLGAGRYQHWGSDQYDFLVEFNLHDIVARLQYRCLLQMVNPFTITRLHDNELKVPAGEDVYTLAEHLKTLTDSIWSELDEGSRVGSSEKPFIHSFRRNLQRDYLGLLENMILSDAGRTVPADANAIARYCVTRLSKKIGQTLQDAELDLASRAHMLDVKTRIDRALEAEYTVGITGSGSRIYGRETSQEKQEPISVLPTR